jgi:hypothetical protein
MKCHRICLAAAVAALAFAAPLLAQPVTLPGGTTTPLPVPQQTFTTGVVGFTTNQTARLNVFNLNSTATATTATNCTVELAFYGPQAAATSSSTAVPLSGPLLGQSFAANFAPGATASLDLPRASVTSETAARAEIRGVVVVNPTSVPASIGSTATNGYCAVFITLEVFDSTGSTVFLTSDTRPMGQTGLFGVISPIAP